MTRLQQFILQISLCCCCTASFATPDAEMPVHIVSDKVTFDQQQKIATYTGHVVVDQGTRNLQAQKLTIIRGADNQIKVMIATGNPAVFRSQENKQKPPGKGSANTIKYYPQSDKVYLINNAVLTQNGDTVSGHKLTYNFATEELQSKSNKQERTTVILQPKRAP